MSGIQLLTIPQVMEMASASVDIANRNGEVDWWGIFSAKVSAGHFDNLVDEIQENGFGMPIVLCDRYSDGRYHIGNGHHRLCAAILLGLWRIPVILSEGEDRDAFMQPNDSMDDYNRPIDYAGTYEYWTMLQENMESGEYREAWDASENEEAAQFYCEYCQEYYNVSGNCCHTCHVDAEHPECDMCQERECASDHICYACGLRAYANADHLMGCPERGWELIEHGYRSDADTHYRFASCSVCLSRAWDDALAENARRVPALPQGVWHPVGVLDAAYAEHEEWLRDEPLRVARVRYEAAVAKIRGAVYAECGTAAILVFAEHAADAWRAYANL